LISKNSQHSSNISYSRVIHLSHLIDTDIPRWTGDPPVEFTSVAEIQDDGYYLRGFALGEHSATHINPHSAGKIRKKVF
jgi:kynurenine formamidase